METKEFLKWFFWGIWLITEDCKMDKFCLNWITLKGQVIVVRYHEHSTMHTKASDYEYFYSQAWLDSCFQSVLRNVWFSVKILMDGNEKG